MAQQFCSTCGATLSFGAGKTAMLCRFCKTSNERIDSQTEQHNESTDNIPAARLEEAATKATTYLNQQEYKKAFNILHELIDDASDDFDFVLLYSTCFLLRMIEKQLGERGKYTKLWAASCDHSCEFYEGYMQPPLDSTFETYEEILSETRKLINNQDSQQLSAYTDHVWFAVENACANIFAAILQFVEKYGYCCRTQTKIQTINGRSHEERSKTYERNDQAEELAIQMSMDTFVFYADMLHELMHLNVINYAALDFNTLYTFIAQFATDVPIPNCWSKVRLNKALSTKVKELTDQLYNHQLLVAPEAAHPLGGAIDYQMLCDYNAKIKEYAQQYIDDGFLDASFVHACLASTEKMRRDALEIRRLGRISLMISLPLALIFAMGSPLWVQGAGLGLLFGNLLVLLYGTKMIDRVDIELKTQAIDAERKIRAQAVRQMHARKGI